MGYGHALSLVCLLTITGCFKPTHEITLIETIAVPDGSIGISRSSSPAEDLIFTHDGERLIAASQHNVYIYDVATSKLLRTHNESPRNIDNICLSNDDRYLMIHTVERPQRDGIQQRDHVKVVVVETGSTVRSWSLDNRFGATATLSPDGKQVIFSSDHGGTLVTTYPNGETTVTERINPHPGVFILDVRTENEVPSPLSYSGFAFTHDGSMLYTGHKVLSYPDLQCVASIDIPEAFAGTSLPCVNNIAATETDQYMLLTTQPGFAVTPFPAAYSRVFRLTLKPEVHLDQITSSMNTMRRRLIYGVDAGRHLFVTGEEGVFRLWNIASGTELARRWLDVTRSAAGSGPDIRNVAICEAKNLIAVSIGNYPNSVIKFYNFKPLPKK